MQSLHHKKCLEIIARKTGWGNYENWTHPQYVGLSSQIFTKCNVLISVSSLKRIFGKIKSEHEPQRETRNALARFIDFTDWDDFVDKNPITFQEKKNENIITQENRASTKSPSAKNKLVFAIVAGIILFGIVAILLVRNKPIDYSAVQFSGKYLSGSSPHTVVFNYDVSCIADSMFIDYDDSFDETPREYLDPKHNTITHHYILPDLYRIRLFHKNKIVRTLHVYLHTDGWQSYLGYNNKKSYFPISHNATSGMQQVEPDTIFETGLVRKDEDILIKYRLVQDFHVNGDNFSFTTKVKEEKKMKTLHCFFAAFIIHGDSGKISVSFTSEDCIHKAWIRYGDVKLEGKYHDLSALAADFTQWQDIELMVKEQRLIIKIAGSERFNQPLPAQIGPIRALLFDTTPSGVMKEYSLDPL